MRFHKETGECFNWKDWKRNCHEVVIIQISYTFILTKDAPRQQNGYDCGVFAIKVSWLILKG
jgi:Ulp1 family protease